MRIPEDYLERCYAGWLGKIIGVRLGAPIEGWEYDKIRAVLGDAVYDYIVDYREFAADDDTNGPMFFLRALEDYTCSEDLTAEEIGWTWLNYTPFEHGFYWWGGYGVSTEHTAYLNLRAGISAPASGSIAQNGKTVAEQIGGQIFIDTWGLVNPGDPERAARFARKAASVSHDGEGVFGGMFVAACVAAAFVEKDIRAVVETGLRLLPPDCGYARMARDVIAFHDARPEPDAWRDCFELVRANYGYDRYPGSCHIIPNSAVMVLAMLYGAGDFTRTIGICNMCGWDTDCTTGNVGAIVGTLVGIDGIEEKWIRPVHDFLACSSVLGCLNIRDVPGCVFEIAALAYRLQGEEPPARWRAALAGEAARFSFDLPRSTHAFRVDGAEKYNLRNVPRAGGGRCLRCAAEMAGERADVCRKTDYGKEDFTDSRYDPAFSPILYPGQSVTASVRLDAAADGAFAARVFAYDRNHGREILGESVRLSPDVWTRLRLEIPRIEGGCIERTGVRFERVSGPRGWLVADIDDVDFAGPPDYTLDFAREREEKWTFSHREISQLTRLQGHWFLEEGRLHGVSAERAEAYTGDVAWKEYTVTGALTPIAGEQCQLMARVQGACRYYAARLAAGGRLLLVKNTERGDRVLAERAFPWEYGRKTVLGLRCRGGEIAVVDGAGSVLLACTDEDRPYKNGAIGFGVARGHCAFEAVDVQGE